MARVGRSLGVVGVLALVTAGCATNPVSGKHEFNLMSEAQEIAIGQELDQQVRQEMGFYDDPQLQRYVEDVGMRLALSSERPNLPWHFAIVDTPAVNAFALPGGYVYITRGILAHLNDESELAGVLGHEIGHVTARHAARQYSRATGTSMGLSVLSIFVPAVRPVGDLAGAGAGLLFLKFSRGDELEADRLGVHYSAANGWDPKGVPDLLTTLARLDEIRDRKGVPNYLSTHPEPADRVERIRSTVEAAEGGNGGFAVNREDYQRRLQGLVYGDNPREGIVRGNEFVHPDMQFAVTFPDGWDITNGSTQIVAKEPGSSSYLLLDLVNRPRVRDLEAVTVDNMRQAGFRQLDGGATRVNGLEAYSGTFEGSIRDMGRVTARAVFVRHSARIYRLIGFAPTASFDAVADALSTSQRSFRGLSRSEAADIRPNTLTFYTVKAGDTWQSIAQGPGQRNIKPSTLAIMNSFPVNEQPQPGDRVKIAVVG